MTDRRCSRGIMIVVPLLIVAILWILCMRPVYAYEGLTVLVPVKGEKSGTYILMQDGKELQRVTGSGTFTLTYDEPGTYTYRIEDAKKTSDGRDLEVCVINDKRKYNGLVTEAVVISKNGKKTDSVDFTKPKPKKTSVKKSTSANAGRPKTGDQVAPLVASIVMLLSASAILVIVAGERRKDEER